MAAVGLELEAITAASESRAEIPERSRGTPMLVAAVGLEPTTYGL